MPQDRNQVVDERREGLVVEGRAGDLVEEVVEEGIRLRDQLLRLWPRECIRAWIEHAIDCESFCGDLWVEVIRIVC